MTLEKKLYCKWVSAKLKLMSILEDEEGDTNFISILVLLGIGLALAGVFLGFKDQVLTWVKENIGDFFSKKGGK